MTKGRTTYKPRLKRMELADYPEAIAEVRAAIARVDQKLFDLESQIERREARFERCIAEDANLRNDTQRRAALKEYRYSDFEYQGWRSLVQNLQEQRTQHEIKLELLRSAFSVAKLQAKRAIADQIAGDDGLSLVA